MKAHYEALAGAVATGTSAIGRLCHPLVSPVVLAGAIGVASPIHAQTTTTGPLPYALPSCTAKESGTVTVSNVQVIGNCASPTDTVDVSFDYEFFTNADRYDFRLALSTDDAGVEKVFYQECLHTALGETPDNPPDSSAGSGLFDNIDGDNDCGDLFSGSGLTGTATFVMTCDPLNQGAVDPNLSVSPVLDWVQRSGDNKGWEFEGPKCKIGDAAGLARFDIPTGAVISEVFKVSNGGTGAFSYTFTNARTNDAAGASGSSITTSTSGVAATDGVEFLVQDLSQDVVLTEVVPTGWEASGIACSVNGSSIGAFSAATSSLTIPGNTLQLGDEVSCTITNAVASNDPTLTLRKVVDNTAGGTAGVSDFSLSYTDGGSNAGSGISGAASVTDVTLPAGTYALSEVGPSGYASALACTGVADSDLSDGNLTLLDGESAICTFTNTFGGMPSLAVVKSAVLNDGGDGRADVGDTLTYTYVVTNTGNVSLFDATVSETGFAGAGVAPVPAYASGGADLDGDTAVDDIAVGGTITFTATYTLVQADIDAGTVTNQATARADDPAGAPVSDLSGATNGDDDPTLSTIPDAPSLETVKTAITTGLGDPVAAGDMVTFVITVRNTGNVSLGGVSLAEDFRRRDGAVLALSPVLAAGDGGAAGVLDVGETWEYRASYALTQADIDAGGVQNQVTASAQAPSGTTVSDLSDDGDDADGDTTSDATLVNVSGNPSFTLSKALAPGSSDPFDAVGDLLSYRFTIANTGNITITEPVAVSDPLLAGQGAAISCAAPPLPPGESLICTGDYSVTQTDLDAGLVTNTASASVVQPLVPANPGDPTEAAVAADSNTVTVAADQKPALTLAKALTATSAVSFDAVGDVLSYDYTVSNSGNVTMDGPFNVDDDRIGTGLACGAGPLAPGASVTCTHAYTITQGDLNAGDVTNTATALGSFDGTPVRSDPDAVTVTGVRTPELSVVKELVSATPDAFDTGTVLDYRFTVTNPGNVTLTGPLTINDSLVASVSCAPLVGNELQPGETVLCTAQYVIEAADLAIGAITNLASATAFFDGNPVVSPTDDAIYPVAAVPALTLVKDSAPTDATYAAVGDVLSYTYTISNTSAVGFDQPILITDNRLAAPFTCHDPAVSGVLNIGETTTCTATYAVTQEDLDAGEVTNEAVASTTFAPGTVNERNVVSNPATKTVPAEAMPALTLEKLVSGGPAAAVAGDDVTFTITASNPGNQTIAGVTISDPLLPTLTCTVGGVAAPANVALAPGAELICTGTYTVLQSDMDAQRLVNTATVRGSDPDGDDVTASDGAEVTLADPEPVLRVVKTVSPVPVAGQPTFDAPGDTVDFLITVINEGNVSIDGITVTDNLPVTPATCDVGSLEPGERDTSCLVTYTVTQADVDGDPGDGFGSVLNIATATGTARSPDAATVTAEGNVTARGPDAAPALTMVKSASSGAITAAGEVISYSYLVTNSGNITLTEAIQVTDDRIAVVNCPALPVGGLAPMASMTCTADYTVTQADVDAGEVTNVATAFSDEVAPPASPGAETDTVTIPVTKSPSLVLEKLASETADVAAGTVITYTYRVTNTGNQTLTTVGVSDQHSSAAGTVALPIGGDALETDAAPLGDSSDTAEDAVWDVLRPGDAAVFSATYIVTQADIDAQVALVNTATVSAVSPDGPVAPQDVTVTIPVAPAVPALTFEKLASETGDLAAGTVVTYTYRLTNSGNQTLTDLAIADQHTSAAGTVALVVGGDALETDLAPTGDSSDLGEDAVWDVLAPGDVATFTASYTVTQADVDAQVIIANTATVTGTGPGATPITETATVSLPVAVAAPQLTALKILDDAALSAPPRAGDAVGFDITVTNTGNQTLDTVSLIENLRRNDGTVVPLPNPPVLIGGDTGTLGVMEVGETWTYRVDYVLAQADIDAGGITNSVVARALSPDDTLVQDVSDDGTVGGSDDDPVVITVDPLPELVAEKVVSTAATELGQMVTFTVTLTNAGNVTLTDVAIAEETLTRLDGSAIAPAPVPVFTGADQGSGAGTLLPGEVATYLVSHRLTQADIDAGGLSNTIRAIGTPPVGDPISDLPDAPAVQVIAAGPAITLLKELAPTAPASFDAVGTEIPYLFTLTNVGNVTLTGVVSIDDPLLASVGVTPACEALPAGGLAPESTVSCTASLTVTQADLDAGAIVNTATATLAGLTSDPSSVTITAAQRPELSFEKIAPDVPAAAFVVGTEATYQFVTTNTGNVTVTGPVTIADSLIPFDQMTCDAVPTGGLAPGATWTCTGTYTVTATDVNLGSVTNVAYATDGTVTSPLDDAIIPNNGVPALSIDKIAGVSEFSAVGDVVPFTFVVTNSGSRAFVNPVTVTDSLLGEIACFAPSAADPDLIAGESVTCSGAITITQDDLDRGFVVNEAYARTTFGVGDSPVLSPVDLERVDGSLSPALDIAKTASPLPVSGAGHDLTYTITVTNTGNQTISNVLARDPMLSGFTCEAAALSPGEQLVCRQDYTVTQSDIDRGTLVNQASVRGVDPQGDGVTDDVTLPVALPTANPNLSLVKRATPSPFGAVGSTLTYLFDVTNTGNVTLTDLRVTDPLRPDYNCSIPTLSPGETDTTCSLAVTVSQDMVDAGSQDNSATVTGLTPGGGTVTSSDRIVTGGPSQVPGLQATKTIVPGAISVAGQPVQYRLTVENTGNVTLFGVSITDVMTDGNGNPVTLDAPFALLASSDADGDGALDVGETWVFTAQRTLLQSDLNSGALSNQVTVTARDPGGALVSDVSDDGIDGDGDREGDPTVFTVVDGPELTVVKRVTQEGSWAGDVVIFEIAATNTGNLDLTGVGVVDSLSRADGTELPAAPVELSVPTVLSPGDVATWQVSHVLTQADVDAGGISNAAVVKGTAPDGTAVSDISSDDDLSDGNTTDDLTDVLILPQPGLTVIKTVQYVGTSVGDTVTFQIAVTNTGSVTLSGISVLDEMTNINGGDARSLVPVFVSADGSPASAEGTLAPGETALYTASTTLTLQDIDAGGVQNSATVIGRTPQGGTISDVSDDDGTGLDDPTVAPIAPLPSFDIAKDLVALSNLFPTVEQATFTITVINTGNLTQTNIQVQDDLVAFLSPAVLLSNTYPPEITISGFAGAATANAGYDGATDIDLLSAGAELAPGAAGTITLTVVYSTAAGQPGSPNTAAVTSDQLATPTEARVTVLTTDTDGDGIPDRLETGDRDGDGIPDALDYDPTGYFYCEEDGRILTGGLVTVTGNGFTQTGVGTSGPITVVRDGSLGFYQFHATQPGAYTVSFGYPTVGVPSVSRLPGAPLDATGLLPANPAALGSTEAGNSGVLIDFTAAANPFVHTFVFEAGDPFVINNNIPLMQCGGARDVVATKQADRRTAVFGETVNYTLTFRNDTLNTFTNARIVDRLPDGLVYTPGSARIDGVAQEPVTGPGRLTWTTNLAPNATLTVTFAARVTNTGTFGERTNRTWLEHSSGRRLSNVAEATVAVEPEHVFDCADVIGKVFHDKNGNGYQDGPGTLPEPILRDDYVVGGKGKFGKLAPEPARPDRTEPGVPGVRLVTPDGTIITTDEFGRFSVPCAALPRDIGTNFQLKLDTRSLPTGFRVTTENPRNIRVTAGKMARMNFGVALGKLVNIDLAAAAFVPGQVAAVPALEQAVIGLVRKIARDPSFLRLTYALAQGEDASLARARLRALEKDIRRAWRGRGTYRLEVERRLVRPSR